MCSSPGSRQLCGTGVVAGLRHPRLCSGSSLLLCLMWALSIPTSLLASTASHFCSLTLSKLGQKSGFFCPWPSYSSWMMPQLSTTSVFPPCWFCLLSPMFSVLFLLLYLVMPVSIPLWLAVILMSFFVSFSLSFPHHFLSDKENDCTFMCFP